MRKISNKYWSVCVYQLTVVGLLSLNISSGYCSNKRFNYNHRSVLCCHFTIQSLYTPICFSSKFDYYYNSEYTKSIPTNKKYLHHGCVFDSFAKCWSYSIFVSSLGESSLPFLVHQIKLRNILLDLVVCLIKPPGSKSSLNQM